MIGLETMELVTEENLLCQNSPESGRKSLEPSSYRERDF